MNGGNYTSIGINDVFTIADPFFNKDFSAKISYSVREEHNGFSFCWNQTDLIYEN